MSRIAKILNTYTNSQGDPEIHFVDDLGKEYTLAYRLEWILNLFDGQLSEVQIDELEYFLFNPFQEKINRYFNEYAAGDVKNWRPVVELEFQN
jgi:hypothetical protein